MAITKKRIEALPKGHSMLDEILDELEAQELASATEVPLAEVPQAVEEPDLPPPPAVEKFEDPLCTYCGGSVCCGRDHPAFSTLHWNDPEELERRRLAREKSIDATTTVWRNVGITPPRY
jgi:hypothetical protein